MSDTDSVFDNWKKLRREISEQRLPNAMTELTIAIENEAMMRVPVAYGNLANSSYKTVTKLPDGYQGEIGFTANYAFYVHEAPGTLKGKGILRPTKTTDPTSQGYFWDGYGGGEAEPKYLAKAVEEVVKSGEAQRILEDNMK